MRRSPGGLMLISAAVLIALAVGSWWLDRVAFSPSNDSGVAYAVLGDQEIRSQVATVVAGATAPTLLMSPVALREDIEEIARIPAGAALMGDFLADAHARLIGQTDDLVSISAEEQVVIVRNEGVADQGPITLPVQRVGIAAFFDSVLVWGAITAFGFGLLVGVAGLLIRPERGEGTFALGVFFASLAGALVVLGYLVPLVLLPALSDDPWMGMFARLANHQRTLTLGLAVAALAVAALIVFSTSSRRERRQGSTPLNVGRYRDDRSWGR